MLDDLDTLSPLTPADKLDVEGCGQRQSDALPAVDARFVRVLRGQDDEIDGRPVESWTWTGDPDQTIFEHAEDAMAAADHFHGQPLEWREREAGVWRALRPIPILAECCRDPDDGAQSTQDTMPDVEGDEDRHPDDEPDTDDEFIRVDRDDDVEYDDEVFESWTWRGDPSSAVYGSAQDAMRAADVHYGVAIDWWEEEEDHWMGERPGGRMQDVNQPDDNDYGTVAHA